MKKETDLRSKGVTLYIPSFGITMSANSYIGSDRMLQTVADLWELHRNSTDREKVLYDSSRTFVVMRLSHGRLCRSHA